MFFILILIFFFFFFFFNDTATTEIYTLSLHDALPTWPARARPSCTWRATATGGWPSSISPPDRKSTRLNSSHSQISYAVFCLKKKKKRMQYFSITIINKNAQIKD